MFNSNTINTMPEINYKAVLEKEKVTVDKLSAKTQRKIADYEKTVKHPFSYKKGTQELTPTAKQKLDDLNDDIIEAIYVVVEEINEKAEEEANKKKLEEEAEAKRIADEEAARLAKEEEEKNKQDDDHFTKWWYH